MQSLGVDVREMFAGDSTLTPRYVLWLVEWLPEDSALVASMRGGPKHRPWTTGTHLAVSTIELLAEANWQRRGKGKPPKPIPRPSTQERNRRTVTVAELNGQREG